MASDVKKCTCNHEFQDKLYGKGMRVHTKPKKETDPLRCTVCHPSTMTRKMRSAGAGHKKEAHG